MKKIIIITIFFFFWFQSFSQISVSHNLDTIEATTGMKHIDINFEFLNTDTVTHLIWLNTWRIIVAKDTSEFIHGVPYMANLVNFVFLTPPKYDFEAYFNSQSEFHDVGFFSNYSLKTIRPNEVFNIRIIITDQNIVNYIIEEDINISYIYSTCPVNKVDDSLYTEIKYIYPANTLVLPNIPVSQNANKNCKATYFYFNNNDHKKLDMLQLNFEFEKNIYNIEF